MGMKRIKYIRWWQSESYKNKVSFTGWIANTSSLKMTAYAIVMFDPKQEELVKKNNGHCVLAIRKDFAPTGTMFDKKNAKKLEKEAISEAIKYKKFLEKNGTWGLPVYEDSEQIVYSPMK